MPDRKHRGDLWCQLDALFDLEVLFGRELEDSPSCGPIIEETLTQHIVNQLKEVILLDHESL